MAGRKPDLVLKGLNRKTEERTGRLGVGWLNEDGSVTLSIDRFITLPTDAEWLYTMFPTKGEHA